MGKQNKKVYFGCGSLSAAVFLFAGSVPLPRVVVEDICMRVGMFRRIYVATFCERIALGTLKLFPPSTEDRADGKSQILVSLAS